MVRFVKSHLRLLKRSGRLSTNKFAITGITDKHKKTFITHTDVYRRDTNAAHFCLKAKKMVVIQLAGIANTTDNSSNTPRTLSAIGSAFKKPTVPFIAT